MELNTLNYAVQIEALTVAYDSKPVLWDIDLNIPKGKLMAIIGPNGAGKTTLIKAMLGLLIPVSGKVRFFKEPIDNLRKLKNKVAYVPQSGSVDWDFPATVLDIVLMGCYGRLGFIKRPGIKDKEAAMDSLKKVGMEDYALRQISQLSGGQQQRVFLARALMQDAEIYLMDEPFKGVDVQTEKAIILLLKELKESGKTVVVVHHDLQTVPEYFDWVTLINIKVIASGPVEEVFHEQNLKTAYRSTGNLLKNAV
ncbi:manganese ABC transporter ATP-binding protein [Anaerocolumna cellulosilytica]|uniref:Manganese ABC transporter ATP-binding protein n=1 Tax=Anaerocolumna cellulosilytica TaxID=433286 RepID=A0A6S6QTH1_9FIRM|nr:metal ABC transporter ATP-binding protein [Anaerocolumna cellulosilytica]MBB5196660.1 manganese/zinc/iron transport system ATP- binding protein [Anaerocolumna cellulosilytica]BCJ93924.1 manganese ABC transporter ATP-binding protein [Anaerocolumna cellulosilytica]